MPNLMRLAPLGLAVGCLATLLFSSRSPAAPPPAATVVLAARGDGPKQLAVLLARFDRTAPGAARDQLAREIDHVAGQRYATVSRLYWYQDLEAAKAAARAQHQPILHLRMLGRLDEDLSCANSRMFRTTLYANAEVSRFLRDHFVLYWSSERPVPRMTIDFGDGRKIERTVTGNSAHYVLDEEGRVLDVLPGLYAPSVFRAELAGSVALADQVRPLDDGARAQAIKAFHETGLQAATTQFAAAAGTDFVRRRGRLIDAGDVGASAVQRAQQATFAKAVVEVLDLQKIGIDAGTIDPHDVQQWATVGQKVWNIGLAPPTRLPQRGQPPAPLLLDAASIALVTRVHAGNPLATTAQDVGWVIARLEQSILADTALDQLRLRPQIRARLWQAPQISFDELNAWTYEHVFHTPNRDPWLGLLEGTDFTGLPADGVVMP